MIRLYCFLLVWFSIYVRWKIKHKHFELYNCTCISNEVSAPVLTGQMLSLGVPSISMMSSIWWMSDLPGSRGRCAKSSPNIHPVDLSQQATHVLLVLLGSLKICNHQYQNFGLNFHIIKIYGTVDFNWKDLSVTNVKFQN